MAEVLTKQNAPNWISWVTDFDAARKTWLDSWHALKSRVPWIEQNAPHLLAQHKAVMQKFLDQVPEIEKWEKFRHDLLKGFEIIGVWFQDTFNLKEYDGRLGAIQGAVTLVVGIGAALALLAAMAEVAKQGFAQQARVDAYKLAMDRGATPDQAAAAVNAALGQPGESQFLGLPLKEMMLFAVVLMLGPPMVKAFSERKQ